MTPPEFDDVVGSEVERSERDRLRRVHDMLVAAGPPAELPPQLEAGPTLGRTLSRRPRRTSRRIALLAAALCVLAVTFLVGYIAGNDGPGGGRTLSLSGTNAAPNALAALRILPADTSGNWPMRLTGTGLPRLTGERYYEVFLVRNGKVFAPCGSFVAKSAKSALDVTLNAPYRLQPHDSWIVTRQHSGDRTPGVVVLRPTTNA
jgi:hypothetical protein